MTPGAIRVRYWAAARAAAGCDEDLVAGPTTLADLTGALAALHGAALSRVLARCSYLVDEVSPGRRDPAEVVVPPGAVVDVLPPFAGGSGAGTPAPGRGLWRP